MAGAQGSVHTAPNHALEPTPTAFARASLRLLARLTAGVRLPHFTKGTCRYQHIAPLRPVVYALSIREYRRYVRRVMEPAAPMTPYRMTDHAQREMARRHIPAADVRRVLAVPEHTEVICPSRVVSQARGAWGEPPTPSLRRVFVDVDRQPGEVVTVYRTSKSAKEWRGAPCKSLMTARPIP